MAWLKNTDNQKDSMFTFAVIAFIIVTIKVIVGGFSGTWIDKSFSLESMDAGLAGVYLGATFSAYWARRHTKSKRKKGKK